MTSTNAITVTCPACGATSTWTTAVAAPSDQPPATSSSESPVSSATAHAYSGEPEPIALVVVLNVIGVAAVVGGIAVGALLLPQERYPSPPATAYVLPLSYAVAFMVPGVLFFTAARVVRLLHDIRAALTGRRPDSNAA